MIVCPTCARENPAEFAFCPACGARLAAPQTSVSRTPVLTEERKVVSTLFCDLVSYTAHSEAADHELIDALLQQYNALARKLVEGHGGVVEKFIGDAVLAVFGFPKAHDDDAERAVRCALKLAAEAVTLAWPDGDPVAVRIGVNSGETYLHTDVDPASGETFLTGDAVNTAARLETAAPPGGVVVGELTHSLTERAIAYDDLPPLTLKGKAEPVAAWLARKPLSRTGLRTSSAADTPFVGRGKELTKLLAAFEQAATSRQAQFALLIGEPGIGKSRLVLELAHALEARPELVTWRQGRCLAYGDGSGFAALSDVVKAHAGILDSDDVATVEAKLETVLPEGDDRPWLRQRLRPLLGLEAAPASQEENFAAWTRFLAYLASSSPAVLVLEDLHWAGEGMLAFVEHLAAQDLVAPLLVVATARPELVCRHPGLLARGKRASHTTLSPLTRRDASRLVSALLDQRLAADVRGPILERIGGNPLYAEEYARLLLDRGSLVRTGGALRLRQGEELPLPDSVQAVLAARLDTLSPDQKVLLCDAAVFGESFWAGGVASLGERGRDEVEQAMAALCDRQFARRLVSSSIAGEVEYAFWHALARDVAYSQLPKRSRIEKHSSAASWLELQFRGNVDEVAEALASHYVTALDLAVALKETAHTERLREPAIRSLSTAGARAMRLDVPAAERHYRRALELAGDDAGLRPRLLFSLAEVLQLEDRHTEAVPALREAIDGLRKGSDRRLLALALTRLAWFMEYEGELDDSVEEAMKLLEEDGPSPERAQVLADQCSTLCHRGSPAREALAYVDQSIAMFEQLGLPPSPSAVCWRGMARLALGDRDGVEDCQRAVRLAEEQGEGRAQGVFLYNYAAVLFGASGPVQALEQVKRGLEFSRERGMAENATSFRCQQVELLAMLGDWSAALRQAEELVELLESTENDYDWFVVRSQQTVLLARTGRTQETLEWLTRLEKRGRATNVPWLSAYALLSVSEARWTMEERDRACALVREWASMPSQTDAAAFIPFVPAATRTAVAGGDFALAERVLGDLGATLPFHANVRVTAQAIVDAAGGRAEAAAAGFADAAARWHEFGVPYEQAQALLGEGRCLLALGRAREAGKPLEQARKILERLGARPALKETDEWLQNAKSAL